MNIILSIVEKIAICIMLLGATQILFYINRPPNKNTHNIKIIVVGILGFTSIQLIEKCL